MRRVWVYALALAAALFWESTPFSGTDVGKLLPVELVLLERSGALLQISTDTQDRGRGVTVDKSLEDLKLSAPGEIFLDTADYILIRDGMEQHLLELSQYLRPACGICILRGDAELSDVARYLAVHPPRKTLRDYCNGETKIPVLTAEQERMTLEQ